jgi:FKBP-type peptidyl-prolyl cis-trans isomerase FkpA
MPATRRWLALASVALLVVTAGCAGSPTEPSSYAPFSRTDTIIGTGTEAAAGLTATLNYTGWIYDPSKPDQRGAQFDSSIGNTPFVFVLGSNTVIQGWEQGLPGMKVGGERVLVIPPALAHSDSRRGPIPPNATLIFQIDLLDVQ